ncbi:MAG: RibD family protein [Granulosicoccus sp.]|nr:RibD family protein [Granulosicoccus sp.]
MSENRVCQWAWPLLLSVRNFLDNNRSNRPQSFRYEPNTGDVLCESNANERSDLYLDPTGCWHIGNHLDLAIQQMLGLYLPILGSPQQHCRVVAHLGQSVDARIATSQGDAFFVTGKDNRIHLHRLRALCQAVVVGAGTVAADDPQLTTREVSGSNPVRVILDPQARLAPDFGVFNDCKSQTLWMYDMAKSSAGRGSPLSDKQDVECVPMPVSKGRIAPEHVIKVLSDRGLNRVFVEGGGVTVSHFVKHGCVNRLQIACAPVIVGQGTNSLQIPGVPLMADALRPEYKLYRMGDDVMWDFNLDSAADRLGVQIVCDVSEQLPKSSSSFEQIM